MKAARLTGNETAMALVQAAAGGVISRDRLAGLLSDRVFAPREYGFPLSRRMNVEDSLAAVDAAYFQMRLLSADQYDHILDTAIVRPLDGARTAP